MKQYAKEADVKKEVKRLLTQHKWFWWMTPANGFGKSGISDFCALRSGVFMAIETKFGPNKPSTMQQGYLGSIRAEDGFGLVVSNRTIQSFADFLEAFDSSAAAVAGKQEVAPQDGATMLNALRDLAL